MYIFVIPVIEERWESVLKKDFGPSRKTAGRVSRNDREQILIGLIKRY